MWQEELKGGQQDSQNPHIVGTGGDVPDQRAVSR